MKKRVLAGILLFVISLTMIITPINATSDFQLTMKMESDSDKIVQGEEVTYVIQANQLVTACNFNITYDKTVLEFLESSTSGLHAAVNGDIVSCIYADIAGEGTKEFKIKFKTLKTTEETEVGITNVKFREKGKDASYTSAEIAGVNEKVKMVVAPATNPTPSSNFRINMAIDGNLSKLKVGNDFIYTITFNEKVVGCNFYITYDNKVLKFVKSETNGVNVNDKGNAVACIYADTTQTGINEIKLRFTPIKEITETELGMTNAKFRAKDKETSYENEDIIGLNSKTKIEITKEYATKDDKKDDNKKETSTPAVTTKNNNDANSTTKNESTTAKKDGTLPKAGAKENTGYILMIISILLMASAIFKNKENQMKNIMKQGGM